MRLVVVLMLAAVYACEQRRDVILALDSSIGQANNWAKIKALAADLVQRLNIDDGFDRFVIYVF